MVSAHDSNYDCTAVFNAVVLIVKALTDRYAEVCPQPDPGSDRSLAILPHSGPDAVPGEGLGESLSYWGIGEEVADADREKIDDLLRKEDWVYVANLHNGVCYRYPGEVAVRGRDAHDSGVMIISGRVEWVFCCPIGYTQTDARFLRLTPPAL